MTLTWTRPDTLSIENWRDAAACRSVEPDLFFPIGTTGTALDHIAAAKAVCATCPVTSACLEFALETNQDSGVWGGTSEEERRQMRRARARARRAATQPA
jgi:WhiB family redox-sensing transcriptional regulator